MPPIQFGLVKHPDSQGSEMRPILQLDYTQATDLFPNPSGTQLAAQTWTDWVGNQSFNIARAGSLVLFVCRQSGSIYTGDQEHEYVVWRFNIDSGAVLEKFGETLWNQSASVPMALQGGSAIVSGLAVGSHQVKVQYYNAFPTDYPSHTKSIAYLRPTATVDGEGSPFPCNELEYFRLQVIELG